MFCWLESFESFSSSLAPLHRKLHFSAISGPPSFAANCAQLGRAEPGAEGSHVPLELLVTAPSLGVLI
ncbi:hypothetical protein L195_g019616 [Trifolium pratense]|uniref:Uncharacterized protein n=1 Tax=Trifolium pratense TaxID=57577 RepID=A0A2K3N035_TRIPR|nr:hypothetical protein L195_g019616 [Trifolium pratense]